MGVLKHESKFTLAFGFFGSIALSALSCGGYVARPAIDRPATPIVPLIFAAGPEVFPKEWIAPPYSACARPFDPRVLGHDDERLREKIELAVVRGLVKYPTELLRRYLARVVLVGTLEFSGIFAAGTNSTDTVYLACAFAEDSFIEETLHHEFSSILLRRNSAQFEETRWRAHNPSDFRYGDSGVQAISRGRDSLEYDEESNRSGFLHQYAQATLEDDFNSIVEKLFMNEPEFWAIVEKYPAIAAKAELAIQFFHGLDPRFTRDYFRGL